MSYGKHVPARFEKERKFVNGATPAAESAGPATEDAFPGTAQGRVAQSNGLYRTNWFNGRVLTAEAYRADQVYTDTRARLVAQIHPAGVAWGLTLGVVAAPAPGPVEPKPATMDLPPLAKGREAGDLQASEAKIERLCKAFRKGQISEDALDAWLEEVGVSREAFDKVCPGKTQPPAEGMGLSTRVQLQPGLAFDDIGRPISVGAPFDFTFADLVDRYRTRPSVVVGGGTQFAPCACTADVPPEAVPAGPSLPEGPYLLLAYPIESGEGAAKIVGTTCSGGSTSETCTVEGWRGGFELRLARLNVEVPVESWSGAWDLRGMLAAWYFDLYEHDLRSRWNRAGAAAPWFPLDGATWKGPGPHARVAAGVPLALVYIGHDGTVLFLDPWIPRRPISSTASAAWAANARGAPTPSARIARVHQFQTMLLESVARTPHGPDAAGDYGPNLHDRGFRHIPPWGFLPVREPPPLFQGKAGAMDFLFAEARAIEQAKADARAWFAGTNVVTSTFVAIHDDDVLEDILRADEKDPVSLRPREPGRTTLNLLACLAGSRPASGNALLRILLAPLLAVARELGDLTMEQLVNREVELVKLVIPMEPRRRTFPIVGRVSDDPLAGLFAGWSGVDPNTAAGRSQYDLLIGDVVGAAAGPRRFVAYVKQRLVVLDLVYLVLDFVLDLLAIAGAVFGKQLEECAAGKEAPPEQTTPPEKGAEKAKKIGLKEEAVHEEPPEAAATPVDMLSDSFLPTRLRHDPQGGLTLAQLRALSAPIRARVADTARSILGWDGAGDLATSALRAAFPELGQAGTWRAFEGERKRTLGKGKTATARSAARDATLDTLAAEHAGFGVLKAISLLLPETETDRLLDGLAESAVGRGDADKVLVTGTFRARGYAVGTEEEQAAYADLRDAYGARSAKEVATGAPAGTSVDVLLAGTSRDAEALLGRAGAREATERIARDAHALQEVSVPLAKADALRTPEFWTKLDAAVEEAGGVDAALAAMEPKSSGATRNAVQALRQASKHLGADGTETLVGRLRKRAGA